MKYFELLQQIQTRLQLVNGFEHDYLVTDFLAPSKEQNSLIVRESELGPEVLLCIEERLLEKYATARFPNDFQLRHLPDLSIVIEELSHFNMFCQRMLADETVSQLELEVQGEVDKFALSLDWLSERNEESFKHIIFDTLFEKCELGDWVSDAQKQRYQEAHHIARQFCRRILDQDLNAEERRELFKQFYNSPRERKLSTSDV